MAKEEKKKSGLKVFLIVFVFIIIAVVGGAFGWYTLSTKGVTSNENKVVFEVEEGQTYYQIIAKLKKENLIKNELAMKLYSRINSKTPNIKAGPYEIDSSWNVGKVIETLEKGPDLSLKSLSVTFLEGKNMRWIAKQIASKTNNTEDDVFKTLKDETYLDKVINKYWFVSNDIKNSDIYYSLEGYLFPDTYTLDNEDVSVEDIFGMMLDEMEVKLKPYKEQMQAQNINMHQVLTMASIVELEASNESDRAGVAGVFYNRLKKNMTLGSDVTTYYSIKVDMSERDLKASELSATNAYNTRSASMAGKLPVGPICSVSLNAIEAAMKPEENDYLFFVADKNGKVYYAKTDAEHQKNIKDLKAAGNWYTYDN